MRDMLSKGGIPPSKRRVTLTVEQWREVRNLAYQEYELSGETLDKSRIGRVVYCLLDWAIQQYRCAQAGGYESGVAPFRYLYRARPVPPKERETFETIDAPEPAIVPEIPKMTDSEFLRSCGIRPDE